MIIKIKCNKIKKKTHKKKIEAVKTKSTNQLPNDYTAKNKKDGYTSHDGWVVVVDGELRWLIQMRIKCIFVRND